MWLTSAERNSPLSTAARPTLASVRATACIAARVNSQLALASRSCASRRIKLWLMNSGMARRKATRRGTVSRLRWTLSMIEELGTAGSTMKRM